MPTHPQALPSSPLFPARPLDLPPGWTGTPAPAHPTACLPPDTTAPTPVLRPQLPPSHLCSPPVPTTDLLPLDPSCLHVLLASYGHAVSVANYSSVAFAPGTDPRVCNPARPKPPRAAPEVRAASMAATSSIHPLKLREPCVPFDTDPLIGSESSSIVSSRCVVALSTADMLTARSALRPRRVPQD